MQCRAASVLAFMLPSICADTELDWVAYMQEVEGYMQASRHTAICADDHSRGGSSQQRAQAFNGLLCLKGTEHMLPMRSQGCCSLRCSSSAGGKGLHKASGANRAAGLPCRLCVHLCFSAQDYWGRQHCCWAGLFCCGISPDPGCGVVAVHQSPGVQALPRTGTVPQCL